jgi:hypothetical protein
VNYCHCDDWNDPSLKPWLTNYFIERGSTSTDIEDVPRPRRGNECQSKSGARGTIRIDGWSPIACLLSHPNFTIALTNSPSFLPISHTSAVTEHVWTSISTRSRARVTAHKNDPGVFITACMPLFCNHVKAEREFLFNQEIRLQECGTYCDRGGMRPYLVRTFLEFLKGKS